MNIFITVKTYQNLIYEIDGKFSKIYSIDKSQQQHQIKKEYEEQRKQRAKALQPDFALQVVNGGCGLMTWSDFSWRTNQKVIWTKWHLVQLVG